jgi:hypothetical protein
MKKPLPYKRGRDFLDGHCIILSISFFFIMFHESQKHEALWFFKNCKLYTIYTLILFNLPHLAIGSKLILTQSEL